MHDRKVRLWWLQETVRGKPQAHLGREASPRELRRLVAAGGDPSTARFLDSLLFLSYRQNCRDIVLPPLGLNGWKLRARSLESLCWNVTGGLLVPGSDEQERVEQLAAIAAGSHFQPEDSGVSLTAWSRLPEERDLAFFRVMACVSMSVQARLRSEIGRLVLKQPGVLDDPAIVLPLLAYRVSRPFAGRPRSEFTYDILDRETVRKICWDVRGPFRLALRATQLQAMVLGAELAEFYEPVAVTETLRRIARERKLLNSLLTVDYYVVEELVRFAAICAGTRSVHEALEAASKLARGWAIALRRGYVGIDCSAIATDLLLTASLALKEAIEREERGQRPEPDRPGAALRLVA